MNQRPRKTLCHLSPAVSWMRLDLTDSPLLDGCWCTWICRICSIQLLYRGPVFTLLQGLPRRLAITVLTRMRHSPIVSNNPCIHIALQLLQAAVHLASKCIGIKRILHRLMETLADPVGLRAPGLGPAVFNIF